MGSCEELEINLGKSLEKSLENPPNSTNASSDKHAGRDNESQKGKREQRIKNLRVTEKSDANIRSYNVRNFSEPPSADSGNHDYDGGCSSYKSGTEPTDNENDEGCMDVKRDRSRGVVSDESPKVETRNLKRARSQQQDHTSKKHWSHRKESRNTKEESKNQHRPEQREFDDKKKRRRGDADELDSNREESTNGRKRTRREDKAEAPPDTDNITQIMKFIRRMALLSDERLMQNLQHGFPLHAQDTILAGFRIIEWFQGTESDLEDL